MGGRAYFGVSLFMPKLFDPRDSKFWGSLYLCLHLSIQNDQIRRGNRYRDSGGLFYGGTGVSHAVTDCSNASRGLSAMAEFLVVVTAVAICACLCVTVC